LRHFFDYFIKTVVSGYEKIDFELGPSQPPHRAGNKDLRHEEGFSRYTEAA